MEFLSKTARLQGRFSPVMCDTRGVCLSGGAMKVRTGLMVGIVMLILTPACGVVDRLSGSGAETVESGGSTVEVNGVPNEPTTAKAEAMRLDSPLGIIVIETYNSQIGPCYDLVFPDSRREANCLHGSGIDPTKPVTGRPDDSIEGLNGPSWNAGLTESGIGMFHHGIAHPTVRTVTVEPEDDSTATSFPVTRAPNVDGLAVYVAWSVEDVDRYLLAGYDADGCLVDWEHVPFGDDDPGGAGRDCSQKVPEELDAIEMMAPR